MDLLKLQFYVLLIGTLFAWFNFTQEMIRWLGAKSAKSPKTKVMSCNMAPNPFLSPCFGGAIFFTIAFTLNILILYF